MGYTYTSLTTLGYTKFKLTKKQHNEIFKNHKRKWTDKYEYYYNEHKIILHKFTSWKVVLLIIVLFPVSVLAYGLNNIKEIFRDHYKLFNQKKYGSFVSEHVSSGTEKYKLILNLINEDR